jgi:hypothetical protein
MIVISACRVLRPALGGIVAVLALGVLTEATAYARGDGGAAQEAQNPATRQVLIDPQDVAAASSMSDFHIHILPARTETAQGVPVDWPPERPSAQAQAAPSVVLNGSVGFYPADLHYSGGPVVQAAKFHNLYTNANNSCPAGNCWRNPSGFLANLGASSFLHLTDQYTGLTSNNRYVNGTSFIVNGTFGHTLSLTDILAIVHAGAKAGGTGYGHIYNVFIPKGFDTCLTSTQCYSPDNLSTFAFCAYHSSFSFTDIGHVIFTVEPYQAVTGCTVPQPSPNGMLIDSTDSTLSHEIFETITDPDPRSGWAAVFTSAAINIGGEVADVCVGQIYSSFFINTAKYEVQLEYSNKYHACVNYP